MISSISNFSYFERYIPIQKGHTFFYTFIVSFLIMFMGGEFLQRLRLYPPPFGVTDAAWFETFKQVKDAPESTEIVFLGSSRTRLGISPDIIVSQMEKTGRKTRCWNLGLGASHDAGLLAYIGEKIKADIVVVEQFGLQFSTPVREDDIKRYNAAKRINLQHHIEENIKRWLGERFMMTRQDSIASIFRHPKALKAFAHRNGWFEMSYSKDPKEIELMKSNNYKFLCPEQVPIETARANQSIYQKYFNNIIDSGSKLVIIRMPEDGKQRKCHDEFLALKYHTDFIINNSNILYIDANTHPVLKKYRTTEYSHLDASDAVGFSRDLAKIIDEYAKGKKYSNH